MTKRPAKPVTEIRGRLEAYVAGEGRPILWSIHDAARPGAEGVHPLLNGDFVTVYDTSGAQIWSGIVDLDFEIDREVDAADPEKVVQQVLGRTVYGLQSYLEPEAWARMFLERREAVLRRYRVPWGPSRGQAR
jgi:hypothetical protein